jgi:predicted GIY-YIG superfamily endonuclease
MKRRRRHRHSTQPHAAKPLIRPGVPWSVYVLVHDATKAAPYVGSTNDLARRLRQHNAHIAGGARRTTRIARASGQPWTRVGHIRHLLDHRAALSLEACVRRALRRKARWARTHQWTPRQRCLDAVTDALARPAPSSLAIPYAHYPRMPEFVLESPAPTAPTAPKPKPTPLLQPHRLVPKRRASPKRGMRRRAKVTKHIKVSVLVFLSPCAYFLAVPLLVFLLFLQSRFTTNMASSSASAASMEGGHTGGRIGGILNVDVHDGVHPLHSAEEMQEEIAAAEDKDRILVIVAYMHGCGPCEMSQTRDGSNYTPGNRAERLKSHLGGSARVVEADSSWVEDVPEGKPPQGFPAVILCGKKDGVFGCNVVVHDGGMRGGFAVETVMKAVRALDRALDHNVRGGSSVSGDVAAVSSEGELARSLQVSSDVD